MNSRESDPKSTSLFVVGSIDPLLNVICVSPPVVTVITSEPLNAILVLESASPEILSKDMSPALVKLASLRSNVPVTSKLPPTERLPDISTRPLMSIVVAASCISVSATRSS